MGQGDGKGDGLRLIRLHNGHGTKKETTVLSRAGFVDTSRLSHDHSRDHQSSACNFTISSVVASETPEKSHHYACIIETISRSNEK